MSLHERRTIPPRRNPRPPRRRAALTARRMSLHTSKLLWVAVQDHPPNRRPASRQSRLILRQHRMDRFQRAIGPRMKFWRKRRPQAESDRTDHSPAHILEPGARAPPPVVGGPLPPTHPGIATATNPGSLLRPQIIFGANAEGRIHEQARAPVLPDPRAATEQSVRRRCGSRIPGRANQLKHGADWKMGDRRWNCDGSFRPAMDAPLDCHRTNPHTIPKHCRPDQKSRGGSASNSSRVMSLESRPLGGCSKNENSFRLATRPPSMGGM